MTQIIPLTKIGFFNPGRLSDEEIEQTFIARIPFFKFILKRVVSEKPNSIPQHHLIIGQRGMGKSSLLARIAAELRKAPYKDQFIPLSFPEEQYNIDRLSKFWLNCLDALADAFDKEQLMAELNALDAEISSLSKKKTLDANQLYEIFKSWIDKTQRRAVLLVDNLNLIFSKIEKEEQHQLRAILISKGAPILVGASATAIDETINYQAPFYDAFQINYLKKLTLKESVDILINLARVTGNLDFINSIYLKKGRVQALYQLTGGTPRTISLLFPLIQSGFSESIQTDLDALLDVITPLYKARFEELSPQLQVVLDAIALHWDPISLEQLRDVTLLENAQLSPQLKRLVDVGWLQKLDAYKTKGGAYEVSERFFNIWYLMRRSSRRQKKELYCLTRFLESFYGKELKKIAKARIKDKIENENQIALNLALADALKEKELSESLKSKSYEAIIDLSLSNEEILKIFSVPATVTEKRLNTLFKEVEKQLKEQNYNKAESILEKIIKIDKYNKQAWKELGVLYMEFFRRYDDAEKAFRKAVEIDEDEILWISLGRLYLDYLERYDEAEQAINKAIDVNNNNSYAWVILGRLYMEHLERYDEAERAMKKAIEVNENYSYAWINLGRLYSEYLERYYEAELMFKKAIEVDHASTYAWNKLGRVYMINLNNYDEAECAFKKAIEVDDKYVYAWYNLGRLYMEHLERYDEAERAFKKAIEIDKDDSYAWVSLGRLYMDHLERVDEAEQAIKKAVEVNDGDSYAWVILGRLYMEHLERYDEAERAMKKAIEVNEDYSYAWISLARLYMQDQERYDEAEQAIKKAIDIDNDDPFSWNNLGRLYMQDQERYDEAERAFKKAIEVDDKYVYAWYNLGTLYMEHLERYDEAERAFKKAIEFDGRFLYAWYNLGRLYMEHLERYDEAERAFKKAIEFDVNNAATWDYLGNLYHDYLHSYNEAEVAYSKALEIDPTFQSPLYNLIFLKRDKLNQVIEAQQLFRSLEENDATKDSYYLNESLFAYYERNIGTAESFLRKALSIIGDSLPEHSLTDWYRTAAVIVKLGFGNSLLQVFSETGYDVILRPFYVAIDAITKDVDEIFFNSVAAELREPAKKIIQIIKNHMK